MSSKQSLLPTLGMEFSTINDCRTFIQAYAKQQGFATGTTSSNNNLGKLSLACVHHGQYRKGKSTNDEDNKSAVHDDDIIDLTKKVSSVSVKKRNCKTGRIGCPVNFFFYRGRDDTQQFRLTKMELEHNHPMALSQATYHVHRKLDDQQEAKVWDMVSAKIPPRAIVDLMARDGGNMIAKDVANLNQRRFAGLDNAGCKDMGGFINYLEANGYEVRWLKDSVNRTVCFFFTHEKCMHMARRFNEVVVVDATYKTNQFRLPFVNMVGVNNVGCDDKTLANFAIAGAWMAKECEVSYTWVMEQLRNTVYMGGKWQPGLFVTDQAQALINAIEKIYPLSNHLLCYVHLMKNMKTNTLRYFTSVEEYSKAEMAFKKMCLTETQEGFDSAYETLVDLALKFTNDKGVAVKAFLNRLMVTKETDAKDLEKMKKLMKKWAGMHANKLAHFGCRSTNRVEGAHATMKSILWNAGGNLQKAYESIHKWYTGMHENSNRFLDRSLLFSETTSFVSSVYVKRVAHLRSRVSTYAYNKIKIEVALAWEFDEKDYTDKHSCTCSLRHAFLLPCRHIISREPIPVPISIINNRWFVSEELLRENALDEVAEEENDIKAKVVDTLKNKLYSLITEIDDSIQGVTNQEMESAIKQLEVVRDELIGRDSFSIILPPSQKKNPQGRPASTKRTASQFEVVDATTKKKAKLLSKMENMKGKDTKHNNLWPTVCVDKVDSVYNPMADGNCGFRSLAMALEGDEHCYGKIKDAMMERLKTHKEWYLTNGVFIEDDINKMNELLLKRGSVSLEHWFYTPDCCQLAADTFLHPIHFHSSSGAMLYLPLTSNSYFKNKPVVLHLQASHITLIKYRPRSQVSHPTIYPLYENICQRANIPSRLPQYTNKK